MEHGLQISFKCSPHYLGVFVVVFVAVGVAVFIDVDVDVVIVVNCRCRGFTSFPRASK